MTPHSLPAPGSAVVVEYEGPALPRASAMATPRQGQVSTVTGRRLAGRYMHIYLTVDTGKHVLDLPLAVVTRVNGQPFTA